MSRCGLSRAGGLATAAGRSRKLSRKGQTACALPVTPACRPKRIKQSASRSGSRLLPLWFIGR